MAFRAKRARVSEFQYYQIVLLKEEIRKFTPDDDPRDADRAWMLGVKNILGVRLRPMQDLVLTVVPAEIAIDAHGPM